KREDELHPMVSGNKFRKLKYTVAEAVSTGKQALLTFGGAYSNHIAAVAAAGKEMQLPTMGYIRGEELREHYTENPTLAFAERCGMTLVFISRQEYREKDSEAYLAKLKRDYPNAYILPEGGTNALAVRGCSEILTPSDAQFDYICTPVGTGGTMAGLVKSAKPSQTVVGYSVLRGTFQSEEIEKYTSNSNYILKDSYCFGGYAKIDSTLVRFMNTFKAENGILLDPVYTAKMMYGILNDINGGFFPKNSRILAIHTGGLQGIAGMNQRIKNKNIPQILT
ncbi:MAG: pyridoxal-phosphate dependent enzyme, partial [Marinirhabdus sp.]|nr:pyridoxal-phosphate dependent enzyme [Marinirhabdus sp.]